MGKGLIEVILQQTELIFYNMMISMKTYDRNAIVCGAPAWRYVYHTLHSCDKWFCNPNKFTEPSIHIENLDKVDIPCDKSLNDEDLWKYYQEVKDKTFDYLEELSDEQLYEKPTNCDFTRLELVLGQFRHFMCHIGILNGITIANTNRYPIVVGLDAMKGGKLIGILYDE